MKILANLTALVKRTDANLPFGKTIQDETETQQGTPIVSDWFQDLLSNIYRLLEKAKITPTNDFDGDSTQYQIIDALQKLPNTMNDIEQVLTLDGTTWSVPLDLSILPNKYFFLARPSDDYDSTETYDFKGSGDDTYSFTSQNVFQTGCLLLVVIDTSGVRAYPLGYEIPKYKSYVALLSHSGIGLTPPTAIVLENNLGFTPTWFAGGVGYYFTQNVEFDSSFIDKVVVFVTPITFLGKNINLESYANVSTNGIWIFSKNGTTLEDGLLSVSNIKTNIKTSIEIRVYE